jgi:nicotinate dehydrogenase subunit A
MVASTRLTVNGAQHEVEAPERTPLLEVLREHLGLRGARFGCGAGSCGACIVIVDGRAIASCDAPLWSVAGKSVTTVEGLGTPANPHPLQRAFIAEQAAQCGYCTSGILMQAAALLARTRRPTEAEVRAALEKNLCRCGVHNRVVRAVLAASRELA